jgi:GT2 family glycosyltransferase
MEGVSVIVLTTGDRPQQLVEALASVRRQTGVPFETILIANGGPRPIAETDQALHLDHNIGVSAGRNLGASLAKMPLLCFIDDDATLVNTDILSRASARFKDSPSLAVIGLRVVDQNGRTARRHHPRLIGSVNRSGEVTSFPGGACLVRSKAFFAVDGYCDDFFFSLEETDLAWRLIDANWTIEYAADLRAYHPRSTPDRHSGITELTASNRVRLAKRCLPRPLDIAYVLNWLAISLIRACLQPTTIASILRGTRDGLRQDSAERPVIAWHTVGKLSLLGRPPLI